MRAFPQLVDLEHHVDRDAVRFEMVVDAGGTAPAGIEQGAQVLSVLEEERPVFRSARRAVLAQLLGHPRQLVKRRVDQQLRAHPLAQLRREAGGAHRAREEGDGFEERAAPVVRQAGIARFEDAPQPGQRLVVDHVQPGDVLAARKEQGEQLAEVARRRRQRQQPGAQADAELGPQAGARREAEIGEKRGAVDLAQEQAQHLRSAQALLVVALEHAEEVAQAQQRRRRAAGLGGDVGFSGARRSHSIRRITQRWRSAMPAFGSAALNSAVRSQGEVPAFAIGGGERRPA